MECKKIQELMICDYWDGEAAPGVSQQVKGHCAQCPECRARVQELERQRALLQKATQQEVPGREWENIRATIVGEQQLQEGRSSRGALERVMGFLWVPRQAVAPAGVLTAVIVAAVFAGFFIQTNRPARGGNSAEGLAEYSVNAGNEEVLYSLGTSVEEYFL